MRLAGAFSGFSSGGHFFSEFAGLLLPVRHFFLEGHLFRDRLDGLGGWVHHFHTVKSLFLSAIFLVFILNNLRGGNNGQISYSFTKLTALYSGTF